MKHESTNNLYFIKILIEALQGEDRKDALKTAIEKINQKSARPEYLEGYQNFLSFVKAVESELLSDRDAPDNSEFSTLSEQAIDILTGIFDGTEEEKREVLAFFKQDVDHEALRQLVTEFTDIDVALAVEIRRGEEILAKCKCDRDSMPLILTGIIPGNYTIQLSNGRQIWSCDLDDIHVQWQLAFPDQEYPAAALTEPAIAKASMSASLLGGSLHVEVFPGIESAVIRISLIGSEGK